MAAEAGHLLDAELRRVFSTDVVEILDRYVDWRVDQASSKRVAGIEPA